MSFYNNNDFEKWSDLFYETLSSCKHIEESWRDKSKNLKKNDLGKNRNTPKQESCNYCGCNDWDISFEGEGYGCNTTATTATQEESKYYQWVGEHDEKMKAIYYTFETDILEKPGSNVEVKIDGFNRLTITITEGYETEYYSERSERINRFIMPDVYNDSDEVTAKYVGTDRHLVIYLTHRVVTDKDDKVRVIKIK